MKKYLLAFCFVLFTALTCLFLIIGPKSNYSENEKRYLAEMPEFSTKKFLSGEYYQAFSSFLRDRIPNRDLYVGINAYTNLALGKNASNKVYFSKDGYLINAPEEYTAESFEKNIDNFEAFSQLTNVPSKLIIVPHTGYVLEDKLPVLAKAYNDAELFCIADRKTNYVEFEDITDVLKNKDGQVFYKTDHHLTSYGNYLLYRHLSSKEETEYKKESFNNFYGTTRSSSGYFLAKPDNIELWYDSNSYTVTVYKDGVTGEEYDALFFKEHLKNDDKYPVFLNGNQPLVKIENNTEGEKNLLIIRDSFAQGLAPFLARDYKNIYLVDMRYYRKKVSELITENKIDEIIYIYGINTLLTDTSSAWLM